MYSPALKRAHDSMLKRVKPEHVDTFRRLCGMKLVEQILHDAKRETGREDAADLPYASQQLEHIFSVAVEAQYPDLGFALESDPILPWNREVRAGSRTWTQWIYDGAGEAVFCALAGDGDIPYVTVLGTAVTGQVENFAAGYGYSRRELRGAAVAGDNLDARKGKIAKRAHAELLHFTAAWGREDLNLRGLFNHPNIAVLDASTKTAGGTAWTAATPTEIIADVNALIHSVPNGSHGLYKVTDVLMPGAKLRAISVLQLSSGSDGMTTTVLEFLMKAHPGVRFRECDDLLAVDSQGNLEVDAMFAYIKGGEFGPELVVPGGMFFEQYPIQEDGLDLKVPCESEIGGVKLEHPLGAVRMDGI